jgi:drug/metabolite transporter (DMT)-like permease
VLRWWAGAICTAAGQVLFAAGARGRTELLSFLNISIMTGLGLYALGTVFWIQGLSRAQLVQVYPFTAADFGIDLFKRNFSPQRAAEHPRLLWDYSYIDAFTS